MDYRRLIKFGNSSFVVSIPKDWLKKNNLQKGDMVYLNENGNNELVLTSKMDETDMTSLSITLDIDPYDLKEVERRIVSKYIAGYDTFVITGEKTIREHQTDIRNILNNLMALEIIEQTKSKIVAKDFLNPSEISFKVIMRRMDTILRSMFDDLKTITNQEDAQDLVKRDNDINRLTHLTLRIARKCLTHPPLAKRLEVTIQQLIFYREIIEQLERIADETKRIGRFLATSGTSSQKFQDFFIIYQKVHQFYLDTMKALYNNDENSAYELVKQRESLVESCLKTAQKYKDPYLFSSFERLKTIIVLIRNIARLAYQGG